MFTKLFDVNRLYLVKVVSCSSTRCEGKEIVYNMQFHGWYVAVKSGKNYNLLSKKMQVKTELERTWVGDLFVDKSEPLTFKVKKDKLSLNDIIEMENKLNNKSSNEEMELNN